MQTQLNVKDFMKTKVVGLLKFNKFELHLKVVTPKVIWPGKRISSLCQHCFLCLFDFAKNNAEINIV